MRSSDVNSRGVDRATPRYLAQRVTSAATSRASTINAQAHRALTTGATTPRVAAMVNGAHSAVL